MWRSQRRSLVAVYFNKRSGVDALEVWRGPELRRVDMSVRWKHDGASQKVRFILLNLPKGVFLTYASAHNIFFSHHGPLTGHSHHKQ